MISKRCTGSDLDEITRKSIPQLAFFKFKCVIPKVRLIQVNTNKGYPIVN